MPEVNGRGEEGPIQLCRFPSRSLGVTPKAPSENINVICLLECFIYCKCRLLIITSFFCKYCLLIRIYYFFTILSLITKFQWKTIQNYMARSTALLCAFLDIQVQGKLLPLLNVLNLSNENSLFQITFSTILKVFGNI